MATKKTPPPMKKGKTGKMMAPAKQMAKAPMGGMPMPPPMKKGK